MKPHEIPAWCFLTGQFLSYFEKNKTKKGFLDVNNGFLSSVETKPKLNEFPCINQGSIIMICYGLIVYPMEFWKKMPQISYNTIESLILKVGKEWGCLGINSIHDPFVYTTKNNPSISSKELFRYLRNALSHGNIDFDVKRDKFIFWNINRKKIKDFEVQISRPDLSILLTGVGRFFANDSSWK